MLGAARSLLQRVDAFFEQHDFLICAVNQVPPLRGNYLTERDRQREDDHLRVDKVGLLIKHRRSVRHVSARQDTADGPPVG
jgi:hypothetical protein